MTRGTMIQNTASANNHKFVLNKDGTKTFTWSVQNFSLPDIALSQANANSSPKVGSWRIVGTGVLYDDLEITFILDENFESYIELYKWMMNLVRPYGAQNTKVLAEESTASLHLMTNQLSPMGIIFNFHRLYPVRLGGITFDTTNEGEPGILKCSATFSYDTFDIELGADKTI